MAGKSVKGFTLIELMIVVAIIAILAAFAIFNYSKYAFRARRAEGQQFLMEIAAAEERFFTVNNVYTTTIGAGGLAFGSATSGKGSYTVVASGLGATSSAYTLTATPAGAQVGDACGNLTLTNLGVKAPLATTTNGNCW